MNITSSNLGSAWFLDGVARLQQRQIETQKQLSSGYRVQDAADDPAADGQLVRLGSSLATFQNWTSNLNRVQAEVQAADQAIGSAVSLIEQARAAGAQGGNATATAPDRRTLADQVQSIQKQLVALANTSVEGRYIFGGDADQAAPYQYNALSGTGVDQLTAGGATRSIVDPNQVVVYQGLTAGQIFDRRDAAGVPAAGNAFEALQTLATALLANDQPGISGALTSLAAASDWVNQQQAYYGTAGNRLKAEQDAAASGMTAIRAQISGIRDADLVQAATDLAQENVAQSAAYGAQSQIGRKSLFDYLG